MKTRGFHKRGRIERAPVILSLSKSQSFDSAPPTGPPALRSLGAQVAAILPRNPTNWTQIATIPTHIVSMLTAISPMSADTEAMPTDIMAMLTHIASIPTEIEAIPTHIAAM